MMNSKFRILFSNFMSFVSLMCCLVALVPLFIILYHLISKGFHSINLDFFTQVSKPVGEPGGGMYHSIVGSGILMGLASAVGLPVGIFGGIYLSEYKKQKFTGWVRFMADMLNGTPSIVIGVFVYTVLVQKMGHFSALSGGVALGIMMIPTVMRTTEEMLKLVPQTLREAGLALGIPFWKVVIQIILRTAKGGIITGVLLAVARIAGETAPLLFTALGNQFFSTSLNQPISSIPLQIFVYAISPFEDWQDQAWAGALVLIGLVFILNVGSRFFVRQKKRR